jgi:hypothetical protein
MDFNGGIPRIGLEHEHHAVQTFAKWAVDNIYTFIASEAYCFSERLWTGGIVDLIYQDKGGRYVVFDFKSAKSAYDSHFLQDAGYHIAISENGILDSDGNVILGTWETSIQDNVYYGVLPFGMPEPEPQFRHDTEELRKGFESCVVLHRLFNSSF